MDITVNPADQGFPPPPSDSQALPTPSNAFVVLQPPPLARSLLAGAAPIPDVDVKAQNLVRANPSDWVVFQAGSFQTNGQGTPVTRTIDHVVVFNSGLPTQAYQIFFTTATLGLLGLDLTGMLVSFPAAAAPTSPENVPQRPIVSWSGNWIYVNGFDQAGNLLTIPGAGQKPQIFVIRDGDAVINNTNLPVKDVVVPAAPQAVLPLIVTTGLPAITVRADSGVRTPFIGSGTPLPPLLLPLVDVASETYSQGLPANVFPG